MQEIKIGAVVCFARDNKVKKGVVYKVYNDFDMVLVNIPEESHIYKVHISDVTVMSDPPVQEEEKNETEAISITADTFKTISTELISSLPDIGLQTVLTLFSEMLCRKLFEQNYQK